MKSLCGGCPEQSTCPAVDIVDICPKGLDRLPIGEVEVTKAFMRGETKTCPRCGGRGHINVGIVWKDLTLIAVERPVSFVPGEPPAFDVILKQNPYVLHNLTGEMFLVRDVAPERIFSNTLTCLSELQGRQKEGLVSFLRERPAQQGCQCFIIPKNHALPQGCKLEDIDDLGDLWVAYLHYTTPTGDESDSKVVAAAARKT